MTNNFEVKTKKALFINGSQITGYIWDNIHKIEKHNIIIATNENEKFSIYCGKTGKLLFDWGKYFSYKITPCYIEFVIQDMGMAFYGALSFEGKILVPFAFGSVIQTSCAGIYEVTCSKGTKAYYITKTKQIINADNVTCPNGADYMFLINNEWKKYSYISGIYTCIN